MEVEPIIEKKLFLKAQEKLITNKYRFNNNNKPMAKRLPRDKANNQRKPNTSCISNKPWGLSANHCAARTAPLAKVMRLEAL